MVEWYPSVSAGWVASEESFMEWTKPVLNSLKFRASWGSIGDQSVPNGLYLSTYAQRPINLDRSKWNKSIFRGFTSAAIDADIQWQDVVTKNIGVDIGLLKNKLNVTFDHF